MRFSGICAAGAIMVASTVAGCSSIIDSYRVFGPDAVDPPSQAAGSYFLPKHLIRVQITGGVLAVSTVAVQDNSAHLQSGFNLSALSDDNITVTYEAGLIKKVTAVATDRTGEIIVQLAKTVAALRTAKANAPESVATFDFDPFDYNSASEINGILKRQHNSCVEVELAPGRWSPGCSNWSLKGSAKADREFVAGLAEPFPTLAPGIYYRRPIAHRVHVVERGKTKEIVSRNFANIAPIFRIDVNRTTFVARSTTLDFTDGVPTSVAVVKPSEALAASKLPLEILNAVISAPVDAIVERKKLVEAETGLTQAQKNNLDANTERIKAGVAYEEAVKSALPTNRDAAVPQPQQQILPRSGLTMRQKCENAGIADLEICAQLFRAAEGF